MTSQESGFRVRGWHVLVVMLAFFAVIVAVNAVMISLAFKSFPGEREEKSYLQGVRYNDRLAAQAAQAALGWEARLVRADRDGAGGATIGLAFADADGAPLYDLAVEGALGRAVDDDDDQTLAFEHIASGRYEAWLDDPGPGAWRLEAVATDASANRFVLEATIKFR